MKTLQDLMTEAKESCEWRAHIMGTWDVLSSSRATVRCLLCDMEVFVCTDPAPNEIDISGEAVALNCKGEIKR